MAEQSESIKKAVVTLRELSEDEKIRLQCEAESELKKRAGGAAKPKAATAQAASEPVAQPLAPNELPENLQRAMHAFGGTITKVN